MRFTEYRTVGKVPTFEDSDYGYDAQVLSIETWDPYAIRHAVAMANSFGGVIYVGVDRNGTVVGSDPDVESDICADLDFHRVSYAMDVLRFGSMSCLRIIVPISDTPMLIDGRYPVMLPSGIGEHQIRTHSWNMNHSINQYWRSLSSKRYMVSMENIDRGALSLFLKMIGERSSDDIEGDCVRTLMTDWHKEEFMLSACMLNLFSTWNIPGYLISIVFSMDDGRGHSSHRLRDPMFLNVMFVLERMERYIEDNGMSDRYHLPSIREALVNAVVNSVCSDNQDIHVRIQPARISISNPGSLDESKGLGMVIDHRYSRPLSEDAMEVFKAIGMARGEGSGLGLMIRGCREAGVPEPIFTTEYKTFKVTFPAKGM